MRGKEGLCHLREPSWNRGKAASGKQPKSFHVGDACRFKKRAKEREKKSSNSSRAKSNDKSIREKIRFPSLTSWLKESQYGIALAGKIFIGVLIKFVWRPFTDSTREKNALHFHEISFMKGTREEGKKFSYCQSAFTTTTKSYIFTVFAKCHYTFWKWMYVHVFLFIDVILGTRCGFYWTFTQRIPLPLHAIFTMT